MLATTSGAIHKNNVILSKDHVDNFLKKQKNIFGNFLNFKNVIYDKDTFIADVASNFINIVPEEESAKCLKNILLSEYYKCEKIYPYLGDYFLFDMLSEKSVKCGKEFRYHKKMEDKFNESLKYPINLELSKWFMSNVSLNRSVNIEKYSGNRLAIECLEDFVFDINYDYSFYEERTQKTIENYRYVIINGIIESVGEIHHLLFKANKTKEPYVIFCFGMSEEVKTTIMKNNRMGKIKVYPVSLNSNDESTLNFLNDIAAIHGGMVLSSDLGITISQEVKKELPYGNKISFFKNSVTINPCISEIDIKKHRSFFFILLGDARALPDVREDVIEKRLKNFTGKRINIYLPEKLIKDKKLIRELDYFLRFISNLNINMRPVSINSEKFYIPSHYINIAKEKVKSLNTKFKNIKVIIL